MFKKISTNVKDIAKLGIFFENARKI